MTVKAVLFDLDDTLLWDERSIKEAFESTCRLGAEEAGLDPERLEEAVRREARALYETYETYPFTKNIGINPFEALWGHFRKGDHPMFRKLEQIAPEYRRNAWTRGLAALGADRPELGARLAEAFAAQRRKLPYVYDETFTVLDELRGRYKLLLLTNGCPDLQQEKLDGVPALTPYFDFILISGHFGEGKPSERLFAHAMEQLGISPEDGVMVGDKLTTDILGANRVGMTSVWINRNNVKRGDEIVPKHEIASLTELPALLKHI
ncbi:HAD family hydrolase [Cohnella pontilimi]|uniref:Phosphoserine phosphatase n=1 Tax=Cohnella pontilimi TaxID=2564100 RepID=A0A4U0FH40_9BACL|nr:HAD family hydrolase [Cohnella pontilimi]TJY44230.1 HAD family hydrolase [Cohnella pontilimi]